MKTICVKFSSLENLARFTKDIDLKSYRIDTSNLILKASLSASEIVVAVEEYAASVPGEI